MREKIPVLEERLLKRTFDHQQTVFSGRTVRSYKNDPTKTLLPRIQDCITKIENDYYDVYDNLVMSNKNIQYPSLETYLVCVISALHFCCNPNVYSAKSPIESIGDVLRMPRAVKASAGPKFSPSPDLQIQSALAFDVSKLIALYEHGDHSIPVDLSNYNLDCLGCLKRIVKKFYDSAYILHNRVPAFDDLSCWILSLTASNVSMACASLTNKTDIPRFVLMDILYRTPATKFEFNLMYDIWVDYYDYLKALDKDIVNVLPNLIAYCISFDSSKLLTLLSMFTNNIRIENDNHFEKTKDHLNSLIWIISYQFSIKEKTHSKSQPYLLEHVTKAQESLVSKFSEMGNPSQILSLKGGFGLASVIHKVSKKRGEQLFNAMDDKFDLLESKHKYVLFYYLTKIQLCEDPNLLFGILRNIIETQPKLVIKRKELWVVFIKKISEFGALDEDRAVGLIDIMVKNKVQFSSIALSELVKQITSLDTMEQLVEKGHFLVRAPLYMKLLYQDAIRDAKNNKHTDYHSFSSKLDFARFLYSSLEMKSPTTIGMMLIGEAYFQPENLYDIYKKELQDNNIPTPDGISLSALLWAAMKTGNYKNNSSNKILVWGNKYASQIAINEFKTNCLYEAKSGDSNDFVYPSDELWVQYLKLLRKFNYEEELYEIIEWWERIRFIPREETLLLLLSFLPVELSRSYIRHGQKYLKNLNDDVVNRQNYSTGLWPWPTESQLEVYKASLK